jgi:hypothetical protein
MRKTPEGSAAITELIADRVAMVARWAGSQALFGLREGLVRYVESERARQGVAGFAAKRGISIEVVGGIVGVSDVAADECVSACPSGVVF